MNRLKLWLYALIVVGAAAAALRILTVDLRGEAVRTLDARLSSAAARLSDAQRAVGSDAGAVATLAARDPKLLETLHAKELEAAPAANGRKAKAPPSPVVDPAAEEAATQEALRHAVSGAEGVLGLTLPPATQIVGGNREWLGRKAKEAGEAERELVELLTAAIGGKPQRGALRMGGQLWHAAAAPAGDGAALALLVPLDASFTAAAASGTGATVALTAPNVKPAVGARPEAEARAKAALVRPGTPADAGHLAPVDLGLPAPKLPKVKPLLGDAPAERVLAVPLAGVKGAFAILSVPAEGVLAPIVRLEWLGLAGVVAALVLALVFGLLVGSTEAPAQVPAELVAAAARIERGDFSTRAPALAGKLGTIAGALNRAAEAVQAMSTAAPAAAPSLTQEFFAAAVNGKPAAQSAPPPPPEPDPSAFEFPARPAAPAPFEATAPAASPPGGGLVGGAFEAAPIPAPSRTAPPPEAPASPLGIAPLGTAPELLQAAALAAAPAEGAGEEGHWREVFHDFLRVRAECGEPSQGLTYDRFRSKLESNKATLIAKYGCRTVRFQVYVKEGKAALKATPVK